MALPGVPPPPTPTADDDHLTEWLTATAAAAEAKRADAAKRAALASLVNDCDRNIEAAVMVDPDRLLRSLSHALAGVMEDVAAAVERLGGARTPLEAIAAGVSTAYGDLGPLRDAYDQIREAQRWVVAADVAYSQSSYLDDPHANDHCIANLDSVFPDWNIKSTKHFVMSGPEPDPRPWPTSDPVQMLIWLSTSGAQPWVPTRRQLENLRAERHRRLNPAPKRKPPSEFPKQHSQHSQYRKASVIQHIDKVVV